MLFEFFFVVFYSIFELINIIGLRNFKINVEKNKSLEKFENWDNFRIPENIF